MQKEFRYSGITTQGKSEQGLVSAKNRSEAKKRIHLLAVKNKLKIQTIQNKRTYLYTVKLPSGKKIKGKQEAFSKEEVIRALANLGHKKVKVEPLLLDFKFKPPIENILMFVNLSAVMLKDNMSFDKIINILSDDETHPTLKETLKKIEIELRKGVDGTEVFNKHADVLGKFPAYMLGLATKSGNMAGIFLATAKFIERDVEYRKSIRQALLVPMFTIVLVIIAVAYYMVSIFPQTAALFTKFNIPLPPLTAAALKFSDFISNYWKWAAGFSLVIGGSLIYYLKTPNGQYYRDKFLIKIPIIGKLIHKASIEIFFRVFAITYNGSASNTETLLASAAACRNAYIERGIKNIAIPLMLNEGMPLVDALRKADVFNNQTLNRLKTGEEIGDMLTVSEQIARYYEKETTYKMENIIQLIQVFLGFFIALIIVLLTIISAELAMADPSAGKY